MAQQTDARRRAGGGRPGVRPARVERPAARRVLEASEPVTGGPSIDLTCINTIRTLSMDAVQAASSGHPGTPMALAPVAYAVWQRYLRFDPEDPIWPNRDRFVLSNGHASMLLYSMLHLTGVKAVNAEYESVGKPSVTLDDLKRFRQLDSKCPGHPEYRWTSGVETTTGPLGTRSAETSPVARPPVGHLGEAKLADLQVIVHSA